MADTDVSEATEPQTGTDHERLGRLEDKLDALADAVASIVPGSHAEAEKREEARLDRGSDFEARVAAEIERAKKADAAAAAEQGAKDAKAADEQSVRDRLAKLEEKPPAAPRLRRTHLLGWGDGRA